MSHKDHWSLAIPCPYKNCSAGKGAQCTVEHRDGSAPSIRENPHVVRLRHAREQGHEPEEVRKIREADTLEEKAKLSIEYEED